MDAAEDDRRIGDPGRITGEFQAVAGKVGNVLDVTVDIKVGEDGRVVLFLEGLDFVHHLERVFFDLGAERECGGRGKDIKGHGGELLYWANQSL